jgi:photosynthetic reaction center cytochrome c subunit
MNLVSIRRTLGVLATGVICLLGTTAAGQTPAGEQAQMAETVYKNIQVLRGIPADQFLETMGMMAASTGLNCTHCHGGYDYNVGTYASDAIELKLTARKMIVIMNTINQSFFGGLQAVTCWTCHQGEQIPHSTANLQVQYSQILPYEPEDAPGQAPFQPTPDQVLDKYLQAIGGAQRANAITSIVATGTNTGYGPEGHPRPVQIYAKADPAQRASITQTDDGLSTTTFDGISGWMAVPHKPSATPVETLSGDLLAGAKLDAELMFPGGIKRYLTDMRVGYPFTLGDRDVTVLQGRVRAGGPLVKLFFDSDTGLLLRQLRYTATPIGRVPTQVDYDDYRAVNGVRIPHKWTVTWTDFRENYEITQVQANVPIPATRFAKPAPPAAPEAIPVRPRGTTP